MTGFQNSFICKSTTMLLIGFFLLSGLQAPQIKPVGSCATSVQSEKKAWKRVLTKILNFTSETESGPECGAKFSKHKVSAEFMVPVSELFPVLLLGLEENIQESAVIPLDSCSFHFEIPLPPPEFT